VKEGACAAGVVTDVLVGACEHEEAVADGIILAVDDVVDGHHTSQSLASII
jgi:hypothetical protein